jgi:hypothetical protein
MLNPHKTSLDAKYFQSVIFTSQATHHTLSPHFKAKTFEVSVRWKAFLYFSLFFISLYSSLSVFHHHRRHSTAKEFVAARSHECSV